MRDKSRGVVWEETIILMPHKVRHVFLSATIPNAKQFAEWICKIHDQPCHVVYTDYRPVPLQHVSLCEINEHVASSLESSLPQATATTTAVSAMMKLFI